MRAVAALSWYQWGWHLLRVINGGFEQIELFSLSGKNPEAASPELVSKRWYCANKSSGIQVLSKSLSLDCSTSPHGPRCWLELQPSQISSESRMEERTKDRDKGRGKLSLGSVVESCHTKLAFSSYWPEFSHMDTSSCQEGWEQRICSGLPCVILLLSWNGGE